MTKDLPGAKACPVCGKPASEKYRPFCAKRCADVDLARWLGGVYRIPTEEPPEGVEAVASQEDED